MTSSLICRLQRLDHRIVLLRLAHADADEISEQRRIEIAQEDALLAQRLVHLAGVAVGHSAQYEIRTRRIRLQETKLRQLVVKPPALLDYLLDSAL